MKVKLEVFIEARDRNMVGELERQQRGDAPSWSKLQIL